MFTTFLQYRGADKSLAHPNSRRILFDSENISFDVSPIIYIYINSTNIPPIIIINRIYETQNLLSLQFISFLVGLRTYQHHCTWVLISPQPDQEGNKLQRQKILSFIYPIYNHNWRNISTIYISTGVLISPQPNLLHNVFCLMVRIFRLMLVLLYIYKQY